MWILKECIFPYFLLKTKQRTSTPILKHFFFQIENNVNSRRRRWNSHYNFIMGYQITLNVLISLLTTAGDTFTFSQTYKKIWLFYHFYCILKVWQNLRVIFIFKNWIELYDIVLYVHMCSRWFIYIFMRLKHLWILR